MQVVVIKAPIDLCNQLRCCLQVDLSGMDIHVAHIGGQPWKPGIDVLSIPIPGQQPLNRKCVSQIVDAGTGERVVMDAALPQQGLEGMMDGAVVQAGRSLVQEEGGVGRAWPHLEPFVKVLLECLGGRSAQRHPTSLSELALGDVEALLGLLEVLLVQGQGFPDPDSRAVEKPQKGPVGVRPKRVRRRQFGGRRQKRVDLRMTIDIGWVSSLRGDDFQGLGHIAARIVASQVLAQLTDHAETVRSAAWGKVRKAQQVIIRDFPRQGGSAYLLLEEKAVEVSKQLRLALIIGA